MKRIWATFFALISLLFGVTTSHAALYFPHVDTTSGWQTEICVINPSGTVTVQGNLKSYKDNGDLAATKSLSVAPNSRSQINVGTEWTAASSKGYIVFENTTGWPVGYTKFSKSGGDRVAVPAVDSVNTGNTYVTHIAWVPWWTGISLVNTTTAAKTLTFRFNTGTADTKTVTLGPKQHKAFLITELFNNLIHTDIVSAVIENASGIVGLELFGMGNQLGGVPLISRTATTLFYPHVDSTGGWQTGIVVYNPSTTTTAQITVNPYDKNGNLLGTLTRTIEAGKKLVGYSTGLQLPAATAWFSLQSQIPLVGFELFGTTDNKRLAGYSVVDLDGKSGIFPKIEKNGGWTGIAFVNTENGQATATIKAHNNAGTVLATGSKTLKAHEKWVDMAEKLFSTGVNLTAATYLSFSADRNVAGFQLNNNSPTLNTMLDALPNSSPSGPKVITRALDLLKNQSTVTKALTAVTSLIPQIISGTTGTCPQVTINPPLEGLENLPPAITITANYGNGCTAAGGSTMSGQVVLAITKLTQTDAGISLDYAFTATNLKQDGKLLLNGSISGHIAVTSASLSAGVHFNNFQTIDSSISGDLTLSATNLESGPITISFNNLKAVGYTVFSGTLKVTSMGSNTIKLDADLVTSQGVVDMILNVQAPTDTKVIVNTSQPGTIDGYTVTLTNVTMDTGVCNGYPSNGSATVSQGGSSMTIAFTPNTCPVIQMMEPAMEQEYPTHDVNSWLNISESLYKILTLEKY